MAVVRAYSVLEIKSVDEDQRLIEGIASTPSTDRMGDIVEPKGATFKLPIPLLWQHKSGEPIGHVIEATVTDGGIAIRAQIAKIADAGKLKDRIDEAWQSIKNRLVRGLSIGFSPLEPPADIKGTWGQRFTKWEWLELSAVTIPANIDASIQTIKSYDVDPSAASGTNGLVSHKPLPGVSGVTRGVRLTRKDTSMPKLIADQIKELEATRSAKAAKLEAIQAKASDEGRTKDAGEKDEFDELKAEIKGIDEELDDLRALEELNKEKAAPVVKTDGTVTRTPRHTVTVEKKLPPGIGYARYVKCKAAAAIALREGNFISPLDVAKAQYPDDSALRAIFESKSIAAGTTSGSHAYDDLVPYQVLASDFIEFLRGKTIIDRFGQNGVPALRRVPFNVRVGGFSAGTTGYWKGEGKPIPVSKATSENVTLTWATVAGLTVVTKELIAHSTPSAETNLRDDLAAATIARMDYDFVDPSKAAVANVSPASITYGIAATTPSGTAAMHVRADLASMLAAFAQANLGRSNLVLIMSDTMAGNIAMMVNALGNNEFPEMDLGAAVPRLRGIPVLTSEHLTAVGSPSTQTIVLVKADEVYLADEGSVNVEASFEASLEMLDTGLSQDATTGTGASLLNLWQTGCVALRSMREINWKLRRPTAVQYISPAAYAPPTT
jgi:HK97 family phage major capsid protein/HK97 family phage prohead protease